MPRQPKSRSAAPPAVAQAPLNRPDDRAATGRPQKSKRLKKRMLSYGLAAANIFIIALAGYAVFIYSDSKNQALGVQSIEAQSISNPLDTLTAAEIAVHITRLTGLPEELAITNQANTINLYLQAAVIEKEYVTKTQILSSDIKSKNDITEHVVVEGETLAQLAAKYGVTSDSIKWSNDLRNDRLEPGTVLLIPPVNGLVYIVGVGDTPARLAETYNSSAAEITAFNDAEITGLTLGERIVIPNGVKQRLPSIFNFAASYGHNSYWRGYCTWYVANKISVPNNWGNANTWDDRARLTPGWTVSGTPIVGAVAQTNRGPEGHVGIVEAVSEDGTKIKYSDMNGLMGWGREGRTPDWVPVHSIFQNFIYKVE